ncbi:MAG TPA: VOC family protein [Candidatus Fimicola cottocaccae]|nr:VOC family protein [Candidatus Fimicola cottocaccae]
MKNYLDHCALNVKDFDWNLNFFKNVFDMTIKKTLGDIPNRKIWFNEGIQLNECLKSENSICKYDHIGICVEDVDSIISKALSEGCRNIEGKENWIILPEGIVIELDTL